ncbi:hypothetical protein LUZ60_002972 [Juncus effusus]|nr:hypothetical protein LUZ60_002972 [Juncus effusus]
MSTTSNLERETKTNTQIVLSSPCEEVISSTIYVQAEPSTFKDLVQKLTGAPNKSPRNLLISSPLPSSKRPKLQERRRSMKLPARLEIPFTTRLQFVPQYYKPIKDPLIMSPISTMDFSFCFSFSSPLSSPSPNSFAKIDGPTAVLSKEEEEREEKIIKEKGFYLHNSPRGVNGIKPKLLPLFPVDSTSSSARV